MLGTVCQNAYRFLLKVLNFKGVLGTLPATLELVAPESPGHASSDWLELVAAENPGHALSDRICYGNVLYGNSGSGKVLRRLDRETAGVLERSAGD